GLRAFPRSTVWKLGCGERSRVRNTIAPGQTIRGTTWSISFREPVCDRMKRSSLRARRPSAREMPGRCGLCLAAEPHRPLLLFSAGCCPAKDLRLKPLGPEKPFGLLGHQAVGLDQPLVGLLRLSKTTMGQSQKEAVPEPTPVAVRHFFRLVQLL